MSPARWEGPSRGPSTDAAHDILAPWPTCSCLACRRARAREDTQPRNLEEAVRRLRREEIYPHVPKYGDGGGR